jgi:hypothetical protein
MIDPFLLWGGVVAAGVVGGGYALSMRDLVRRGRLHRRAEQLAIHGDPLALPDGRVPCPQCAEAIQPAARRCPYCRSRVTPRR